MTNVINFPGAYYSNIDATPMLQSIAATEDPKYAFVIVWPEDGGQPSFHSNTSDVPVILYQLQRFIHKYFDGDFTEGNKP
jgi:hypothetical protein